MASSLLAAFIWLVEIHSRVIHSRSRRRLQFAMGTTISVRKKMTAAAIVAAASEMLAAALLHYWQLAWLDLLCDRHASV